jgi:hypothetical protein
MSLIEGMGWDLNTFMYIFLLLLGGFFMMFQLKIMMFPHKRGRIVEFEDLSEASCTECKSKNNGRMTYNIKVETDDGDIVDAELSPCTMCMDGLRVGSRVGVSKIGSRTIAQSVINLKPEKGNFNQNLVNN